MKFSNRMLPWISVMAAAWMGFSLTTSAAQVSGAPSKSAPPIAWQAVEMVSVQNGWAASVHQVFRTNDGGRVWDTELSLPPKVEIIPNGCDFLNSQTGFLLAGDLSQNEEWLYETQDGGRHWKFVRLPRYDFTALDFVNPQDGWIMSMPTTMGSTRVILYRSQNSGTSWTRVFPNGPIPRVLSGGTGLAFQLMFRSPSDGWITGYYPGTGKLYFRHSIDGGQHWTSQALPLPSGARTTMLYPDALQFFGSTRMTGVFPLWVGDTLYTFRTLDGGYHWMRLAPLSSPAVDTESKVIFGNTMNGWTWCEDWNTRGQPTIKIARTLDGGQHWETVYAGDLLLGVGQVSFFDRRDGMAVVNGRKSSELFGTRDGGRTWIHLVYTVVR